MLSVLRKCTFRIETHFLQRCLLHSTVWSTGYNQENVVPNSDDRLTLKSETRRFLKVALIGLPNVGKSTLINHLTNRSTCPTSSKVHTTIKKADAIYVEGNTQIVFMDTPGLTTPHEMKKYKLLESFKKDPEISVTDADVIGIIQDASNIYTRYVISNSIKKYLECKAYDTPLLLILNKVDKLEKKHALLDVTRQIITNVNNPKFDDIFMISALSGDGVDDLRNYFLDSAKEREWQYEENLYSDQSVETIIEETVRAKLMDVLMYEIPYTVKVKLEHFDVGEDNNITIVVILECQKDRHVSILLKRKAFYTKTIAVMAEKELRNAFRTTVHVRLNVKCVQDKAK